MKALVIGDNHLSDQNPVSRADDFRATGLRKFSFCIDLVNSRPDIDIVFLMGDVFNKKKPSNISHYLVNAINNRLDQSRIRPHLLLGNHDVPTVGKGLEYYPVSNLKVNIMTQPFEFQGWWVYPHGTGITEDTEVVVSNLEEFGRTHDLSRTIVLFHENVYINDKYLPLPGINLPRVSQTGVKYILFGHIHKPFGPTMFGDTLVHNPGAMMRVSRAESDLALIPTVSIVDFDAGWVERIEIPHQPASEIMLLDIAKSDFGAMPGVSAFVDTLQGMMLEDMSIDSIVKVLGERKDITYKVREKAIKLLTDLAEN